ncbi:MAG: folate-binding protein, partial [Gammaproteobacteria bacterium]|nr:folate-binding protein [Gammaproteobacteria bacterium]
AVADFGDPAAERRAALSAGAICDLSHRALIAVEGEDAFSFLQGQLTCDMNEISGERSRLAAWCSPKGRVLALFRLLRLESGFLLELPKAQLETTLLRLSMYVLRARVSLEPVSDDFLQVGLAGGSASELIAKRYGSAPELPDQVATAGGNRIIRLRGDPPRFQFIGAAPDAKALWESAAGLLTPAGFAAWSLLGILAGVPEEVGGDEHLPQMINLDVLEGLSFTKGCYVGQEIIARTHHLGRLKRRMYVIASAAG